MNNEKYFSKAKLFVAYFGLLIATVALMAPRFYAGFWNFTDDGAFLLLMEKISGIQSINLNLLLNDFSSAGRFNPVGLFIHLIRYSLCGSNFHFMIIWNTALLFLTSILIFNLINKTIRNTSVAFVFSILYTVSCINIENYYRLFPYEPILVLFIAVSLNLLVESGGSLTVKKIKWVPGALLLALTIFIKETAVHIFISLVFLVLIIKYILKKDNEIKSWVLLSAFSASICVIYFVLRSIYTASITTGSYSKIYSFDINKMILTLSKYFTIMLNGGGIIIIAVIFYLMFIYKKNIPTMSSNKKFILFIFLLTSFSLLILLPWEFGIARYLLPTNFYMTILIPLCFPIKELWKERKNRITLSFILLAVLSLNIMRIYHTNIWLSVRDKSNYSLLQYLSSLNYSGQQNIYFVYEGTPESVGQVKDLLYYLYGKRFNKVEAYKNQKFNKDDIIVFPYQGGDGMISSDKFFGNNYSKLVFERIEKTLERSYDIQNSARSFAVYPDFFVFNLVRLLNIKIPDSLMGDDPRRNLFEYQTLCKEWRIYLVKSV